MKKREKESDDNHNNSPMSGNTNSSTGNPLKNYQDKESFDQEKKEEGEQEEGEQEEGEQEEGEQEQDDEQDDEQEEEQEEKDDEQEEEVKEEQEDEENEEQDDNEIKKDELFRQTLMQRQSLSLDLNRLSKEYATMKNELHQSQNEVTKLNSILQSKNTIIAEFQKLLQGLVVKLEVMENTNISFQKQIEEYQSTIEAQSKTENEYKAKSEKHSKDIKDLNELITKYKKEIEHYPKTINLNQHSKESLYKKKLEEKENISMQKKLSSIETSLKMTQSEHNDKLATCQNTISRLDKELQTVCIELKKSKEEVSKLKQILIYYESIIKDSDKKLYNKDTLIKIHIEDNGKLIKELNDKEINFDEFKEISNKKVDIMYKKLISIDEEKYSLIKEKENSKKEIASLKHKSFQSNNNLQSYLNEELNVKLRMMVNSLKALKDKAIGYDKAMFYDQSPVSNSSLSSCNSTFVSNGAYDDSKYSMNIIKGIEEIITQFEEPKSLLIPQRSITPTLMTTTIYSKRNKHSKSSNHSFTYEYINNGCC